MSRSGTVAESVQEGAVARYEGRGRNGTLTRPEAKVLLKEQRASGGSFADFARERGIGVERLRWWKKQLVKRSRAAPAPDTNVRLLPVRVRPARAALVESDASGEAAASTFDVRIGGGALSVRVPAEFDAWALRRLLATLTEKA